MATVAATTDPALLPAVCDILHRAFSLHDGRIDPPSAAHRETPETLARKLERETLLVARDDAGAVLGCIFCRLETASEAYIGRLAVDPSHQRRGVARTLLLAALDWAREQGAVSAGLNVRVELTENIDFFERHGFAISREDRHPGYDRTTNYYMERRL